MKKRNQAWVLITASLVFGRAPLFADDKPATSPGTSAVPQAASNEVPQGGIEVARMLLCKDVKDHECDQEINAAKVGDRVVGWTQIRSGLGEVTVTHRWLHENTNLGDIPLAVKSSPWRTWSRKTVSEAGNWKWQVLDSSGAVLKELAFTVTPSAAPSSSAASGGGSPENSHP